MGDAEGPPHGITHCTILSSLVSRRASHGNLPLIFLTYCLVAKGGGGPYLTLRDFSFGPTASNSKQFQQACMGPENLSGARE